MIFYAEKEAQAGSLAPEAGPAALPIREAARGGLDLRAGPGSAGFISDSAQPSALCVPVSRECSEPGALTLEVFGTHRCPHTFAWTPFPSDLRTKHILNGLVFVSQMSKLC
ncbi:hypothetical protein CapIbe_017826 [Capra ibex]